MKNKKLLKSIEKYIEEQQQRDISEGIVGYALFDKVKRAFVTFTHEYYQISNGYTGDVEVSYVADTRSEALDTMVTLDDYFNVKIVPLISNNLFGLSPAPGSLDNDYNECD